MICIFILVSFQLKSRGTTGLISTALLVKDVSIGRLNSITIGFHAGNAVSPSAGVVDTTFGGILDTK